LKKALDMADEINILRFSYGLNGLLLQCRDIPLILQEGRFFYTTNTDAIDIWLGRHTTYVIFFFLYTY